MTTMRGTGFLVVLIFSMAGCVALADSSMTAAKQAVDVDLYAFE
jgi:hypothetical protein